MLPHNNNVITVNNNLEILCAGMDGAVESIRTLVTVSEN